MDSTYTYRPGVATRWATAENRRATPGGGGTAAGGRKGSPCVVLGAGESLVIASEPAGTGVVRRIWCTLTDTTPRMLRSLRIDIHWDGAVSPAVSSPLGEFFGVGLGRVAAFDSALFSSPEGRSFVCTVPMPFRDGFRAVVTNESEDHVFSFFYEVDYTVGDVLGTDDLWFHAHWRSTPPGEPGADYVVLPEVRGRGRYLGACLGVAADMIRWSRSWWGEGEVKIYLDGDGEHPTLCGTGTEDYLGTGWELGRFAQREQGCTLADAQHMQFAFYRYHLSDPVWFAASARVELQQIGSWRPETKEHWKRENRTVRRAGLERNEIGPADMDRAEGYGLFERSDLWCSTAWFYLDTPGGALPPLAEVSRRLAALPADDGKSGFRMVPEVIRNIGRYVPGAERLKVEDLRRLREACDQALLYGEAPG